MSAVVQQKAQLERKEVIKRRIIYSMVYIVLGILLIACLVPFYLVLINATRDSREIQSSGLSFIPGRYFMENLGYLQENGSIMRAFMNSLFISVSVTFLSGYFSALTAYAFYVYKFKGNKKIFAAIILFMMVPSQLAIIGFFEFMNTLSLVDTYIPLIIPAMASIGTLFFLRQYVESTVHMEVVESARMDGASEMYTLHRIGIPLMMPGIATMSIFTFIGSWNNYMGARVMIQTKEKYTLPLFISMLKGTKLFYSQQGGLYVGLAISIVPIMIFFAFFSRYLVDSIAAGAVKG